jgi:choline dehydrogenase-like flavoprotein
MSHVAWSDELFTVDADYVVVGSGAGGSSAAVALARGGASVVLVEAGAWRDPVDYPETAYGAVRDLFDDWGSTITSGRAWWPVVQARAVGGSTTINSAICVRTPSDVFARWQRETGTGAHLEAPMNAAFDEIEAELSVAPTAPEHLHPNNLLAAKGADASGISGALTRRFARGCVGSANCLTGCREGKKQSTNVNWVPEVRDRGVVLSNAPVRRLIVERERAVGVQGWFVHPKTHATGGRFAARARRGVVIAMSATRTGPFLARNGVRLPALGQGFRAHPGAAVLGVYDDPVDMHRGATQGWSSLQFRNNPGFKLETLSVPADMMVARLPGGGAELVRQMADYRHLAMWVYASRAESVGTVGTNWLGKPTVTYSLDTADMARFRHATATLARMHFAAGARAVMPGIYGLPKRLGPDDLKLIDAAPLDPRRYFGVLSHLFGGAVFGADPSVSAVDGHGRVHGVRGLYVADAAAIPTNLGVNPQLTIMSLARVWARGWLNG